MLRARGEPGALPAQAARPAAAMGSLRAARPVRPAPAALRACDWHSAAELPAQVFGQAPLLGVRMRARSQRLAALATVWLAVSVSVTVTVTAQQEAVARRERTA
jgi:hypothetical protein